MFVPLLVAASGHSAYAPARAYVGTIRLNSSDTSPSVDNVLPYFHFLSQGNEGTVGVDLKQPPRGLHPYPANLGNSLPDYLLNHGLPDTLGKVLPWRLKDGWTSSRTPTDVPTATLENEFLRVDVMPRWGGHVHRAVHKKSGRHLCFMNEEHQPVNDGEARAMTLGGIQWNWLPNQLGHAVFTQNPVYVAKLRTERGDALRVWEFDRWNGTTWQLDLHLRDETLWAHVRLINPNGHEIEGYWWTDHQMPMTSPTARTPPTVGNGPHKRCKPSRPDWPGSRVISPAWGALAGGRVVGGGMTLVEWPRFSQGCCGFQQNMPGSFSGTGIDMSYLSNYSDPTDAFLQCLGWNDTASPFVALVDHDHYGEQVGMIHGHSTPFNKVYSNGNNDVFGWSQTEDCWNGCFVELQIGVAPSQLHSFPLAARSSHHHSEYFKLLDGIEEPERLYSDDYAEAVKATADFINSERGVPRRVYDDMHAWMEAVSKRPLRLGGADEIMFNGTAHGGLAMRLAGAKPAASVVYYDDPAVDFVPEDTRPWRELLGAGEAVGKFSDDTLEKEPTSFVTGAGGDMWLDLLHASAETHGWSWLHHLHVGFEAVERCVPPPRCRAEMLRQGFAPRSHGVTRRACRAGSTLTRRRATWSSRSRCVLARSATALSL